MRASPHDRFLLPTRLPAAAPAPAVPTEPQLQRTASVLVEAVMSPTTPERTRKSAQVRCAPRVWNSRTRETDGNGGLGACALPPASAWVQPLPLHWCRVSKTSPPPTPIKSILHQACLEQLGRLVGRTPSAWLRPVVAGMKTERWRLIPIKARTRVWRVCACVCAHVERPNAHTAGCGPLHTLRGAAPFACLHPSELHTHQPYLTLFRPPAPLQTRPDGPVRDRPGVGVCLLLPPGAAPLPAGAAGGARWRLPKLERAWRGLV